MNSTINLVKVVLSRTSHYFFFCVPPALRPVQKPLGSRQSWLASHPRPRPYFSITYKYLFLIKCPPMKSFLAALRSQLYYRWSRLKRNDIFIFLISQQILQLEKLSKEDCHLGALSKQFKNNCKILLRNSLFHLLHNEKQMRMICLGLIVFTLSST